VDIMFWTNFVKTVGKILLVIMLLVTFVGFIAAAKNSILAGLGVLVGGTVFSFITVSGIMLICEISDNIGAIKNHLTGTSNTPASSGFSFNELAQNLGVNLNQNTTQQTAPVQPQSAPVQQSAPAPTENAQQTQNNTVNLSK